jgi:SAM-dependent methyltransferase
VAREPLRPLVGRARKALARLAMASPVARRAMGRLGRELCDAASLRHWRAELYGPGYFGSGRDPSGDRGGLSGYGTYDRLSSNADIAGTLLWRHFGGVQRALDVGCATGYLVEVLREHGIDAEGCDMSEYAVAHPAPGAAGHLRVADLLGGLPWPDGSFDLVCVLETLEHLPPGEVAPALAELRRVCRGFLYATIPSFGTNDGGGPDGVLEGKVRDDRLEHYRALGPHYLGPVPFEDLFRDARGDPVEGHLTVAAYRWWTGQFAAAGFRRRPDIERRVYADIEPAGLELYWNVYVFAVAGADESLAVARHPEKSLVDLGLRHPLYGT